MNKQDKAWAQKLLTLLKDSLGWVDGVGWVMEDADAAKLAGLEAEGAKLVE